MQSWAPDVEIAPDESSYLVYCTLFVTFSSQQSLTSSKIHTKAALRPLRLRVRERLKVYCLVTRDYCRPKNLLYNSLKPTSSLRCQYRSDHRSFSAKRCLLARLGELEPTGALSWSLESRDRSKINVRGRLLEDAYKQKVSVLLSDNHSLQKARNLSTNFYLV